MEFEECPGVIRLEPALAPVATPQTRIASATVQQFADRVRNIRNGRIAAEGSSGCLEESILVWRNIPKLGQTDVSPRIGFGFR